MKNQTFALTDLETHRRLVRVAERSLPSVEDAEDVVQDAYVRFIEKALVVESVEAWLITVVRRIIVDRLRRLQLEKSTFDLADDWRWIKGGRDQETPDQCLLEISTRKALLENLLSKSSADDTAMVLLKEVFGVQYEVIAESSGRSPAACRQAVRRALRRVRQAEKLRSESLHPESLDVSRRNRNDIHLDTAIDTFERALQTINPAPLFEHLRVVASLDQPAATTSCELVPVSGGMALALVLDGVRLCILPAVPRSTISGPDTTRCVLM